MVRAKHLDSRQTGKPGIIKIDVNTLDQKIILLKNKRSINNPQNKYKYVYIRSSKIHMEKLLELHTYTLLQEIPTGWQFTFTANGWLVKDDGRRPGPGLRQTFNDRNQWGAPSQHPGPTPNGTTPFNQPQFPPHRPRFPPTDMNNY